jgi:uncharacterized membrane protein YtjA (UPF0391 family)
MTCNKCHLEIFLRRYSKILEVVQRSLFSWALTFLIIAIIAGVLGLSGIAGVSTEIAWILFVVGIIVSIVFFIIGRRPPPV